VVLGELIEDESGKITGQRVLDVEGPKMESSFTMAGLYKDVQRNRGNRYRNILFCYERSNVCGCTRGNNSQRQGMATYTAQAIGRFTSPGKVRFHGSVFYRTTPTSGGTLSFLNNVVGVCEYEGDEQGNCSVKVWEWK
jgi:hypothetical protein